MISTKIDSVKKKMSNIDIDQNNNSFVIIPYYHSGADTITNNGYSEVQRDPKDFETFKQIWTGNDACVLSWKNSTYSYQDKETLEMKVAYRLGEYILGELEVDTRQVSVMRDKSYSEYTSQESEITLTFRVSKDFEFTPNYDFYFYKVPEIYKDIVFRLDSVEKNWVYDNFIGQRITLKSVNQDYANTGRARQQNIMPNSPGQGYLNPVVKDIDWPENFEKFWYENNEIHTFDELVDGKHYIKLENGKYLTGDFQKIMNRPVKKVIVKCFGAGIINSFVMSGRQVALSGAYDDFGTPEVLFPLNFQSPTSPTYFRTQQETQNFYFGSFSPLITYIKDFMTNIKDMTTPLNKWENQGLLQYDEAKLEETNLVENGKFKYSLFGEIVNDNTGNIIKKTWKFSSGESSIGGLVSYGVDNNYILSGEKEIHDHFWDNYWISKEMKSLPFSTHNSLGFGFTLGSSIGAMVTKQWWVGAVLLAIGIVASFITWITTPKFKTFRGIISCDLIDLNKQYKTDNMKEDCISFNILQSNSKDNPSSIFFDGATMNTSFEADITNLFVKDGYVYRTSNIGQNTDENGNTINNGLPLLVNGTEKLVPVENQEVGFIIDDWKLCACFNGEISVEFKDADDNIVWSGVYQSQGKWTNSLREIWTEKKVSVYGRENMYFTEPLPYPKEIPVPTGGNLVLDNIVKNFTFTNTKQSSGNNYIDIDDTLPWDNKDETYNYNGFFGSRVMYYIYADIKTLIWLKWCSLGNDFGKKEVIREQMVFEYSDIINDFITFKKYFNEVSFSQSCKSSMWGAEGRRGNSSPVRPVYNQTIEYDFYNDDRKTMNMKDIELDTIYEINGFQNYQIKKWDWHSGSSQEWSYVNTLWKSVKFSFFEKDNQLWVRLIFDNTFENLLKEKLNFSDDQTVELDISKMYKNSTLFFRYFDIYGKNCGISFSHSMNIKIKPRPVYSK